VSELPQLERALAAAAHRHYGQPRWRSRAARSLAVAAALAAIAIVAIALVPAVSDRADERPVAPPAEQWATTVNATRGFTISLPPGWQLAPESLTPSLLDPRELFSAATFPLAYRRGPCDHMPTGALKTMGPADAFVSVQERGGTPRRDLVGFPPRPASFATLAETRGGDISACLGSPGKTVEYWRPFSDANRRFYALVVLGTRAPKRIREEAFAVLDRLRFDPTVQPDWKSTP
jgi:hypothetical protein